MDIVVYVLYPALSPSYSCQITNNTYAAYGCLSPMPYCRYRCRAECGGSCVYSGDDAGVYGRQYSNVLAYREGIVQSRNCGSEVSYACDSYSPLKSEANALNHLTHMLTIHMVRFREDNKIGRGSRVIFAMPE